MSYIEDYQPDVEALIQIEFARRSLENGKCVGCGGKNIKKSKNGNLYCADLCWVKKS